MFALVGGCELLQPPGDGGRAPVAGQTSLPPVLEQMRKAYPDLASGRFISLADFESPGQVGLFRTVGRDGTEGDRPQPALSILHNRNETGVGSLKVRLERPDDRLLFDGKRSAQLALIRDWRNYALLLVSVFAPPEGISIEFSVQSGEPKPIQWKRTIHVTKGWNLWRLDLDTLGDTIDLADVRALGWQAPQLKAPVEFYLDDIILADNTRQIVGENAGPEELHVFTRGRRIHVCARDRFELAFLDGQIAAWRDLGGENLVDTGGLGPWPVPLSADWATRPGAPVTYDDPQLFASWGPAAAATQRLVEVSTHRVVLEGEWRFANPPASQPSDAVTAAPPPGHTWRYVVYPSGTIYIAVQSRAPAAGWSAPRVGYALGLDARRNFRRIEPPGAAPGADRASFALLARAGKGRADLLWTWPKGAALAQQRELVSADERRLAVIAGDVEAGSVVETTHLLRIWPPDIDAAPEGESFTRDYQNPARITATVGQVRTDIPGDANHDGFNEAEGCYELALVDGALRFDFDPGAALRFDPVFRVHEAAGRQCWVYVRGRAVQDLGRDHEQNLLFHLGHVSGAKVALEVHTASAAGQP